MTNDDFKLACDIFLSKYPYINQPATYKIGDEVKTKSDKKDSYISKVIGVGKKGVVVSECSIPLVSFGQNTGEYYICQEKLKPA